MSSEFIILDISKRAATFTPLAVELRDRALESSALVGRVTGPEENARAVEAQKEIHATIGAIEKARKAAKEPILDLGRAVDAAAKQFAEDLEAERSRVSRLIGDFQELEAAKVRAAEAAARLAAEQAERERRAELRRIAQEEAAKRAELDRAAKAAAEAAAKANSENAKAEAAKIQADIDRQRAIAEAKSIEDMARANQEADMRAAAAQAAVAAPTRAAGQVVKYEWEITVESPFALATNHPECVRIEPRMSEIKSALDQGRKLAGVTARKVVVASVRATQKGVMPV